MLINHLSFDHGQKKKRLSTMRLEGDLSQVNRGWCGVGPDMLKIADWQGQTFGMLSSEW